jgi:hypothetical protein
MMRLTASLMASLFLPALALAQAPAAETPPPPPPMVNAPEAPAQQPAAAGAPLAAGAPGADTTATPPPPGANPPALNNPGMGYQPGYQSGYQQYYGMPYGQPGAKPQGPEIGLMVTESAFGILTGAAEVLLPYLLFALLDGSGGSGSGSVFSGSLLDILFVGIMIAEPLAVSQTIIGIANSSHYYYSESWPAMLTGLGAEAAFVGLYFLVRNNNETLPQDPVTYVMVASAVVVPLAEVIVINLTKKPRASMFGALNFSPQGGWQASIPMPMPYLAPTTQGMSAGLTLPLFAGRF